MPTVGFTGTDSFIYTAGDGLAESNTATCRIMVRPVVVRPSAAITVTKIVEMYDPAWGTTNEVFRGLDAPQINASGTILVRGAVNLPGAPFPDDKALWLVNSTGARTLRVREGDVAAGTAGAQFQTFNPVLNDAHEFSTRSQIMGAGVITSNRTGIWDTHGSPTPRFLARLLIPRMDASAGFKNTGL